MKHRNNRPHNNRPTSRPTSGRRSDKRFDDRHEQPTTRLVQGYYLYGVHAVEAALQNKKRRTFELVATSGALDEIQAKNIMPDHLKITRVERRDLDQLFSDEGVHQGLALRCDPLPSPSLDEFLNNHEKKKQIFVMLDQVTDPHNVGAILRSCAALGADAIIAQDRNSPDESATLAKSACGAAEHIPILKVVNLSRTLDELKDRGFFCVGLDERGTVSLPDCNFDDKVVVVMGAEGQGLRRLVAQHCDQLITIPTHDIMKSLNVSNALAVTLYEIVRTGS